MTKKSKKKKRLTPKLRRIKRRQLIQLKRFIAQGEGDTKIMYDRKTIRERAAIIERELE